MGFDTIAGKKLFSLSSGKFLPDVKRQSHGYPVYGGNGVAWYTDAALIDHPTIVIGRVGAYCGNVKVVKEPVWITDNAIYITRILSDRISLDFLYHLMSYLDLPRFADYVGQPKITQKPLESLEYIVPPKEAQDSFVSFVQQSDKSKLLTLCVNSAITRIAAQIDSVRQLQKHIFL